jgi:hypothetical protein
MADTDMDETMNEINGINHAGLNMRDSLKVDISALEKNIKDAQDSADKSASEVYSYLPVSPEQANESKKNIVFLKKDLATKKSEYEKLDQ